MCFTCTFVCRTRAIAADHLSRPPARQPHQILLLAALGEPPVSERVPEKVRVDVGHAGSFGTPTKDLTNAVLLQRAFPANPQRIDVIGDRLPVALTQIAPKRFPRFAPNGTARERRPLPRT